MKGILPVFVVLLSYCVHAADKLPDTRKLRPSQSEQKHLASHHHRNLCTANRYHGGHGQTRPENPLEEIMKTVVASLCTQLYGLAKQEVESCKMGNPGIGQRTRWISEVKKTTALKRLQMSRLFAKQIVSILRENSFSSRPHSCSYRSVTSPGKRPRILIPGFPI